MRMQDLGSEISQFGGYLGLMETEEIVKSGASGVGNPVVYVGSTTGRDGMGGASFASAELTEASPNTVKDRLRTAYREVRSILRKSPDLRLAILEDRS